MTRKLDLTVACLVDQENLLALKAARPTSKRLRYNLSVIEALRRSYRTVHLVGANPSIECLDLLARTSADVVFNLAFSGHPLEASFAGALELVGLPYTGSGPRGITIANDKVRSRRLLAAAGVRVPRFVELKPDGPTNVDLVPPLIVKPVAFGGCRGIHANSVVTRAKDVERLAMRIWQQFGVSAVCDEFVVGREFRVGLIESVGGLRLVGVTEWHFPSARPGWGFKTESIVRNPHARKTRRVTRALVRLSPSQAAEIGEIGAASFAALGVRGYATIDLRTDASGQMTVIEVNANAGLWSGSSIWSNPSFSRNIRDIVDAAAIVRLTPDRF